MCITALVRCLVRTRKSAQNANEKSTLLPAMTDYNKWNKIKMSDLGWTEQDEYQDRVTPAMQEALDGQSNQKRVQEARDAIAAARKEQARLKKLTAELEKEKESTDRWVNLVSVACVIVIGLSLWAWQKLQQYAPSANGDGGGKP
jgi:hypothetical protein